MVRIEPSATSHSEILLVPCAWSWVAVAARARTGSCIGSSCCLEPDGTSAWIGNPPASVPPRLKACFIAAAVAVPACEPGLGLPPPTLLRSSSNDDDDGMRFNDDAWPAIISRLLRMLWSSSTLVLVRLST